MIRTLAILSPGDMGSGLGRLLCSKSVRVVTNLQGRSTRSQELAKSAGIEDLGSDNALLTSAEVVLSVLVPSFATATSERIASSSKKIDRIQLRTKYYIDANAVAPSTSKKMSELFVDTGITFIDGGIIGGPPRLKPDGTWSRPTLVLSGPGTRDANLDDVFDIVHVGTEIGQASALKMSFASLTKGFTAIAIQSLGTAHANGLLDQLLELIKKHNANSLAPLQNITTMPPKAYRWVGEMEEISKTFSEEGFDPRIFLGAAETYRWISEETELGKEVVEHREKGKDIHDVCHWLVQALQKGN